MNLFSLEGKLALVAGASRGIGLACAQALGAHGAEVILASRDRAALERESAKIPNSTVETLDIADAASVRALTDRVGEIDILLSVAGTNVRKHFAEYTEEEYRRLFATNVDGVFQLTQQIGARMVARKRGGKIITVGSLQSLYGFPYVTVYAMTKSALAGMTRTLAAEWGRHDIQVNLIAPGVVVTELTKKMWEPQNMHDWLSASQAMPRPGTPEEVAGVAVFLAAAASNYVTGQMISVDGGHSTTGRWPFEP